MVKAQEERFLKSVFGNSSVAMFDARGYIIKYIIESGYSDALLEYRLAYIDLLQIINSLYDKEFVEQTLEDHYQYIQSRHLTNLLSISKRFIQKSLDDEEKKSVIWKALDKALSYDNDIAFKLKTNFDYNKDAFCLSMHELKPIHIKSYKCDKFQIDDDFVYIKCSGYTDIPYIMSHFKVNKMKIVKAPTGTTILKISK